MESLYLVTASIVTSALMAVELWLLMAVPAAADPFIAFLTIGIVPGTDRRLTLEETYLFIGLASVLVLAVTFQKQVLSPIRRKPQPYPGHMYGYAPVRYMSAARSVTQRRKKVEWRKALELDRVIVFAVRRAIRRLLKRMSAAKNGWDARVHPVVWLARYNLWRKRPGANFIRPA